MKIFKRMYASFVIYNYKFAKRHYLNIANVEKFEKNSAQYVISLYDYEHWRARVKKLKK